MTKLPRDLNATTLLARLRRLGYVVLRQRGSHMTLYTTEHGGHRAWIPRHDSLAPGTLRTVLGETLSISAWHCKNCSTGWNYESTLRQLISRL